MKKNIILIAILIVSTSISACTPKMPNETKLNEKSLISTISNEKSNSNHYEELDKLPQKYTSEMAQQNGDVVGVHGKSYNIEKLDKFIDAFKDKKADAADIIRITTYTIEGDAVIHDLVAGGEGIKLISDNTRDNFASSDNRKKREYKVVDIFKKNQNAGIFYMAKTDKGEEIPLVFVNN